MNKTLKKGKLVIEIEYEAFTDNTGFETIQSEIEESLIGAVFDSVSADNPIEFSEQSLKVDFQDAADN